MLCFAELRKPVESQGEAETSFRLIDVLAMKGFGKIEPRRRLPELSVAERNREREREGEHQRDPPFRFSAF